MNLVSVVHARKNPSVVAIVLVLIGLIGAAAAGEKGGSVVSGIARFNGARPARQLVQLTEKDGKLSDCHTLHDEAMLDENLIVGEKGELCNVFIYVKKGLAKQSYPTPSEPAVLNQVGCMFRPRVQGVMIGQDFVMKNGDPVLHNVRALSFRNRPFNIAQPAESPDRTKVFRRKERAVMIQCDLHPWMKAHIFVMDHPFFAVSDEQGRFRIEGLPAGDYTFEAWHEELGKQDLEVTVALNGTAEVEFAFEPKENNQIIQGQLSTPNVANVSSADPVVQRPFVKKWTMEDLASEAADLTAHSRERGQVVFQEAGCIKCHVMQGKGTKFGPDLTEVTKRFAGLKLLEQIIKPSIEIHKDFQTQVFHMANGQVVAGLLIKDEPQTIHVLPNPLQPDAVQYIHKSQIDERQTSAVSTMPEGLLDTFVKGEILDLLAYLQSASEPAP